MSFPFYTHGKPGWEKLTTTAKKHRFGELMFIYPNRWFAYGKAGEALIAGNLCEGIAAVANHDLDLVTAVAGVGAVEVTVTLGATAATVDQYADGFLILNDLDEEGHQYLVKSHPAAGSTETLVIAIDEEAGLVVALPSSQQSGLVANPYSSSLLYNSSPSSYAVGVPAVDIASGEFGWFQIKGPAMGLGDASTPAKGAPLVASATQGAFALADNSNTVDLAVVGTQGNSAGASGEFGPILLNLGLV